jgi:protein-disulfide isomerase
VARKEKTPGEAARRRRRQELRREQATTGSPDLAKSANKGAAKASAKPPEPAFWQSPTFLVTAAAIIATLVLIYVLNNKPNPPLSSLTPPANPVPASIPRSGTLLGVTTAPVRMDTWEDFQCPFCDIWTEQWEPHVIQDFVAPGIVQYKFNNYAFLGDGHDPNESLNAAVAALCAGDQGKFWEYHDWLYANQNPNGENHGWFVPSTLNAIALKVGLNLGPFDTCLADPAKAAAVQAERTAGTALGVQGTPSIFVDGKQVTLTTYADLAALIRSLAGPASSAPAGASPNASPAGVSASPGPPSSP